MTTTLPLTVINFWGEPGAGKSTLAAGLFHMLKLRGFRVELVTEYAKDATYRDDRHALGNQLYMLAKQDMRLRRLVGQVDWVITDSPLPLCQLYATTEYLPWINVAVAGAYTRYSNVDFLIHRTAPYAAYGRSQSEEEARLLGEKIKLAYHTAADRPLAEVPGSNDGCYEAFDALRKEFPSVDLFDREMW